MIKEARQQAETHLKKIEDHYGKDSPTTKNYKERHTGIHNASRLWNWCNTAPAVLFAVFVFFIAGWVLYDWDSICSQADGQSIDRNKFPWSWFYLGLLVLVIVDFLCFVFAAIAWARCKFISRVLRHQYDSVLEDEMKQVTPLEKT